MALRKKQARVLKDILGDWYGKSRAETEIVPYLPRAVKLSDILDKVSVKFTSDDESRILRIKEAWTVIAGAQNAKYSEPVFIKDAVLFVEVRHSLWMANMAGPVKKAIIDKINGEFGKNFCKDMKFIPPGRRDPDKN